MINLALLVRVEAKPGKEPEVEKLLRTGFSIVEEDRATTNWYGIRLGPSSFGIFDGWTRTFAKADYARAWA